jgi:four helix bundle protein
MPTADPDLKERTRAFALRVITLYSALPASTPAQVLGKQLLRSGTSVGANYRETHRARSKAEFIAKMGDCLKELDESAYWLDLLAAAEILPASRLAPLIDETHQLTAIFVTIIKRTKSGSALS